MSRKSRFSGWLSATFAPWEQIVEALETRWQGRLLLSAPGVSLPLGGAGPLPQGFQVSFVKPTEDATRLSRKPGEEATRLSSKIPDRKKKEKEKEARTAARRDAIDAVMEVIKAFGAAMVNINRYPPTSAVVVNNVERTLQALEVVLSSRSKLTLAEVDQKLLIDDKPMPEREQKAPYTTSFLATMAERNVRSISFSAGIGEEELRRFLTLLNANQDTEIEGGLAALLKEEGITHITIDEKIFVDVSKMSKIESLETLLNEKGMSLAEIPPEAFTKFLAERFDFENLDKDAFLDAQGDYDKMAGLLSESAGLSDPTELFPVKDERIERLLASFREIGNSALQFDDPEVKERIVAEASAVMGAFDTNLLGEMVIRKTQAPLIDEAVKERVLQEIGDEKRLELCRHLQAEFRHLGKDQTAQAAEKVGRMEDMVDFVEQLFVKGDGALLPDEVLQQLERALKVMGKFTNRKLDPQVLEAPRKQLLESADQLITGLQELISPDGEPIDLADLARKLSLVQKLERIELLPEALERALENPSPKIRQKAAELLASFNEELIERDLDKALDNVVHAVEKSVEQEAESEVLDVLVETLEETAEKLIAEGKYTQATQIVELFNRVRGEEEDAGGTNAAKAREAVNRLGKNRGILELLTEAFRTSDGPLHNEVMASLISLRENAVGPLLDLLETAENMRVRKNALEAVARIGRRALPPLRAALENDPEWYLKRNIITILGKISGKEAFEILARYMEDPDVRIRREVVRSIAQKRNLAAEDIFIRGLNDSDHAVRHACIVQLGVLRSRKALPELLKEVEIGLFTRVDEKIFREACTAIGKIGDKRGVEPLLSILKRRFIRGNLEEIQASVIWALGEIADESARGELTRFFQGKNPRLRSYAEAALQKLDDKRMNLVAEELEEEEPTIATSLDEEPEEEDAPPPANPR